MAVRNNITPIPLTSIDSATFTGAYQVVNTAGLPFPCFMLRIVNNSDRDITVSFDGATDNDFVPHGTSETIESQTNSQPINFTCLFPKGTKVYVKGLAGGTGLVYLAGYAQRNEV